MATLLIEDTNMKKRFALPQPKEAQSIMAKLGYQYHCSKDGRPCYHRPWNDARFPRFHAYVTDGDSWMEIDLHVDALDTIHHRGNHNQSWAYEGGRISQEIRRITDVIEGTARPRFVAGTQPLAVQPKNSKRMINSIIDFLFF